MKGADQRRREDIYIHSHLVRDHTQSKAGNWVGTCRNRGSRSTRCPRGEPRRPPVGDEEERDQRRGGGGSGMQFTSESKRRGFSYKTKRLLDLDIGGEMTTAGSNQNGVPRPSKSSTVFWVTGRTCLLYAPKKESQAVPTSQQRLRP